MVTDGQNTHRRGPQTYNPQMYSAGVPQLKYLHNYYTKQLLPPWSMPLYHQATVHQGDKDTGPTCPTPMPAPVAICTNADMAAL